MSKIDSIRVSGATYEIEDANAASALSGKQDTLVSGTNIKTINNESILGSGNINIQGGGGITSGEVQTMIDESVSGKQDTLISGTNIKTINNESILGSGNITIEGGGGGKAVSGGTFISVTTGETADTINCTIPAFFGSNNRNFRKDDIRIGTDISNFDFDYYRISIGRGIQFSDGSRTRNSIAIGSANNNTTVYSTMYASNSVAIGEGFNVGSSPNVFTYGCIGIGYNPKITSSYSTAIGTNVSAMTDYAIALGYNASVSTSSGVSIGANAVASGTTKTNINNQLITDTSNQVYVYNKDNTEMIHLQDYLQIKAVKLTQSEYDALATKDSNTLYVIVN